MTPNKSTLDEGGVRAALERINRGFNQWDVRCVSERDMRLAITAYLATTPPTPTQADDDPFAEVVEAELRRELAMLRAEVEGLKAENARLRAVAEAARETISRDTGDYDCYPDWTDLEAAVTTLDAISSEGPSDGI